MTGRRVVVTGIGAVTPVGNDMKSTWRQVVEGRSGIAKVKHFDASSLPSQIAGEVKGLDFEPWVAKHPNLEHSMANTRFAVVACQEALEDSDLDLDDLDTRRLGLYYAAGDSGARLQPLAKAYSYSFDGREEFQLARYVGKRQGSMIVEQEIEQEPYMTMRHLIRIFNIRGPVANCLTACAASAQAIGEGSEMIRRGRADVVISGGSHSMIHPFGMAGFCLLTTLSTANDAPESASRPFDATRNGFVLSEGAGCIVLEEFEHARRRGARIYGELVGYGSTADAYRLTDSHPEGRGAVQAMQQALGRAGISPSEIHYVNAHGTSTQVNDLVETMAVKKVFGDEAYRCPVSSTKSMTGHLIAAAGVLELELCLLAMRDGVIPPTINYHQKDPECDLDYVPNHAREKKVKIAMSNSFGFGGQNVVLIVKKI